MIYSQVDPRVVNHALLFVSWKDEFFTLLEEILSADESDIGDLNDHENYDEEDNIPDFNINDLDIVLLDDNFERNGVSDEINSYDDEELESKDDLPLSVIRKNKLKRHTICTKSTEYCVKQTKQFSETVVNKRQKKFY
ncbi:hypothetical protein FQA39_LY16631 [Lamprigera yunnana]|nr:hypothetical protein FQA39_LY16631 [Lamprigera yunnana]